jgi:hypothetical protein
MDIDPAGAAIIAMDFQASALGFLPDPKPLLYAAVDSIETTRAVDGKVAQVRVGFTPVEIERIPPTAPWANRSKRWPPISFQSCSPSRAR